MKCPGCGVESRNALEACGLCGSPLTAASAAQGARPAEPADDLLGLRFEPEYSLPGQRLPGRRRRPASAGPRAERGAEPMEMLDDDAIEVGADDLDIVYPAGPGALEDDGGPPFRIDDDLFSGHAPAARPPEVAGGVDPGCDWPAAAPDRSEPVFALASGQPGAEECGAPIIDRDDEVPERCWAPEVAGLGRRALALLVDQALLLAVLGIFFLGTVAALRLGGFDAGPLLAAGGVQASALPFTLLGAVLSLAYCGYFHGSRGCTPGKALVGIEVRTGAGGAVTWDRAILRWLGAALGLACAGVGIVWALFEPRRRGWADLISGTVVALPRRGPGTAGSRR